MQNAIVYRSVRMIAEAAASVPLPLYRGAEEIEEHALLDLIARPSPDRTSADFLEAWYGFLLVAGNAYVEAVAVSGRLRELHVLRPDRMKVIPGPDGWPEAFEYSANGTSVRFAEEPLAGVRPVLHTRLFRIVIALRDRARPAEDLRTETRSDRARSGSRGSAGAGYQQYRHGHQYVGRRSSTASISPRCAFAIVVSSGFVSVMAASWRSHAPHGRRPSTPGIGSSIAGCHDFLDKRIMSGNT